MNQDASLPLPHFPEPVAPRRDPVLIVVCGVMSLVLWMLVVAQFLVFVPKFENLASEFRMKLPWLTEWVIRDAGWCVPAILVVAIVACLALGRRSSWPWLFVLILLPLFLNLLVGLSIYFPYMELLEGLETGKK